MNFEKIGEKRADVGHGQECLEEYYGIALFFHAICNTESNGESID